MPAANSQFDAAAIEAIVREVVNRLTNSGRPSTSNSTVETDNSRLACGEKLITMQTLRGKLDNVTTLRLKPKTIVTPAVRDELRDRNIEIAFDLVTGSQTDNRQTILLGTNCKSTGKRLTDQLAAAGNQVQLHTNDCIKRLATTVGNKISTTLRAIIVTDQPYTAACVANRNANVLAVIVRDEREMIAAKTELNPNCVVVGSGHVNQINLSAILQQLNQ